MLIKFPRSIWLRCLCGLLTLALLSGCTATPSDPPLNTANTWYTPALGALQQQGVLDPTPSGDQAMTARAFYAAAADLCGQPYGFLSALGYIPAEERQPSGGIIPRELAIRAVQRVARRTLGAEESAVQEGIPEAPGATALTYGEGAALLYNLQQLWQRAGVDGSDLAAHLPAPSGWLADLYADQSAWQGAASTLTTDIAALSDNPLRTREEALDRLRTLEALSLRCETVYAYAKLSSDASTLEGDTAAMLRTAQKAATQLQYKSAYTVALLAQTDAATLEQWAGESDFSEYAATLRTVVRQRAHILSPEIEGLLARAQALDFANDATYDRLTRSDLPGMSDALDFDPITDPQLSGALQLLNESCPGLVDALLSLAYTPEQSTRETFAALLCTQAEYNAFLAETRGYDDALSASLSADDIPEDAYTTLMEACAASAAGPRNWAQLQSKLTIQQSATSTLSTDATLRQALLPLGSAYAQALDIALAAGWVAQAQETGGTNGSYALATYASHPHVLLAGISETSALTTTAHELGHAVHLYLSSRQPQDAASPNLLIAEVAAAVNEQLLFTWQQNNAASDAQRAALATEQLTRMTSSYAVQAALAAFEDGLHRLLAADAATDADALDTLWQQVCVQYGVEDWLVQQGTWAQVPHFYASYYVYKYPMAQAVAAYIAAGLTSSDAACAQAMQDAYLELLQSGSSQSPAEALSKLGVDLTQRSLYDAYAAYYARLVQIAQNNG